MLDKLTELANEFRSDKGSEVGAKHNYTPIYNLLFAPYQQQEIKFLEIGLQRGGPELGFRADRHTSAVPSINMWLQYFEKADIIGFDISNFSEFESDRFSFVQGDSGAERDLQELVEDHGPFDIVLDDASHASFHQLKAFERIFPHVRKNGMYIIEDLHWQPKQIEEELPKCPTGRELVNYLDGFVDEADFVLPEELSDLREVLRQVSYSHGFIGYKSGLRAVKTAVFHRGNISD